MSARNSQDFSEIWRPRIGEEATALLRRSGYMTLWMGPTILILALISSFSLGSGKPLGWAIGLLAAVLGVTMFATLIRSRAMVAAAISRWFEVKINWYEMPRMRTAQFDAWRKKRSLGNPRESA